MHLTINELIYLYYYLQHNNLKEKHVTHYIFSLNHKLCKVYAVHFLHYFQTYIQLLFFLSNILVFIYSVYFCCFQIKVLHVLLSPNSFLRKLYIKFKRKNKDLTKLKLWIKSVQQAKICYVLIKLSYQYYFIKKIKLKASVCVIVHASTLIISLFCFLYITDYNESNLLLSLYKILKLK